MVKKHLLILFIVGISLVFTLSCLAQAKEEFENLVRNPDFEDFSDAPWTMWVEDGSAVALKSIDKKSDFLTDTQSLLIDISKKGGGMRVELHQNPFVLKACQKMIYAMWAKVEKDEVREARMVVNHRAAPWTGYGSKNIQITDEWTEFWLEANITDNDNIVGIYVEMRDTVGKIWFDHFRFYEGKYIEEALGQKPKAVEPNNKIAATWAKVKNSDQ